MPYMDIKFINSKYDEKLPEEKRCLERKSETNRASISAVVLIMFMMMLMVLIFYQMT